MKILHNLIFQIIIARPLIPLRTRKQRYGYDLHLCNSKIQINYTSVFYLKKKQKQKNL